MDVVLTKPRIDAAAHAVPSKDGKTVDVILVGGAGDAEGSWEVLRLELEDGELIGDAHKTSGGERAALRTRKASSNDEKKTDG